jgi:monothiol glutaredoxin
MTRSPHETDNHIRQLIATRPILIFMKGQPDFPRCGFSARAVEALREAGARDLAWVDVLSEPDIRSRLPQISDWPTFPQVFIGGELIGGADITEELLGTGELARKIQDAGVHSAS